MTKSRGLIAPRRAWSEFELAVMRMHYPDTLTRDLAELFSRAEHTVHAKARAMGVRKSQAFLSGPMGHQLDGHRGKGMRFQKGNKPWSAGTKGVAGQHENSRRTQFAKGRPAAEARNYVPIGTLRINVDGYLERKFTDDPALFPVRRWIAVHREVWIAANGPVPEGHVIVFKKGRRSAVEAEITLDALECITRGELALRNKYPKELQQIAQLRGAITRQINKRLKEST